MKTQNLAGGRSHSSSSVCSQKCPALSPRARMISLHHFLLQSYDDQRNRWLYLYSVMVSNAKMFKFCIRLCTCSLINLKNSVFWCLPLLVSGPCQHRLIAIVNKGDGVCRNKPTSCQKAKKKTKNNKKKCPGKRFHQVLLIKNDLQPSGAFWPRLRCVYGCLCVVVFTGCRCDNNSASERKSETWESGENTSACIDA